MADQVVFVIGGERGQAGGTGQRVAAKGTAVDPYEDVLLYSIPKRNGPYRKSSAQSLGRAQDVWIQVMMLDREPLAGTSNAGLNLIGNE
jgi:hypothetical protein